MVNTILSWFVGPHDIKVEPIFKVREVWSYTHIDPRTQRVVERPVLVYRKATDGMFWGLPLQNVGKNGKKLYVPRMRNGKKVSALSQMRTLKVDRLVRRLGVAGEKEFGALNASIVRLLAPERPKNIVRRREQIYSIRTPLPRSRTVSPISPVYILQPR